MEQPTNSKKCRKVGPYLLLKQIGRGSYSTVFEATADGQTYAVKQISLENLSAKTLERLHL
jgi:serine/threonine protein kinase